VTESVTGSVNGGFEQYRRLLFTVAYDLLGSAADAEDVVQDAWLRWSSADRSDVVDPKAYLVRVTTNLALNRLRSARVRRETYVGPWLPEPLLTTPDVADEVELAEAVSMALLVVLETLSPVERAVFVLREIFGLSSREVAEVLDRSEVAVRQLAHRAREHVQARRPRYPADRRTQERVTERFRTATLDGDVAGLVAAMAPGVTLMTDGGGRAKAALRPIVGADKVARFLVAIAAEGAGVPDLRLEAGDVNGAPAILAWTGSEPFLAVQVHVEAGRIDQVFVVRNPDKLAGLTSAHHPSVR
jgi:RNA polymerase sigma-70 factor (TIGR02957 family)